MKIKILSTFTWPPLYIRKSIKIKRLIKNEPIITRMLCPITLAVKSSMPPILKIESRPMPVSPERVIKVEDIFLYMLVMFASLTLPKRRKVIIEDPRNPAFETI